MVEEVEPVRDLTQHLQTDSYRPSGALAEQVRLRDKTCAFPRCTRPARSCDLDHVIAYDRGGKTASDNLAPLCRLHHRLKTHGDWSYQMLELGVFLWRSPYGYLYRRDASGTEDITPAQVHPPPRRTS
jgi:5-methylcytosine-specific restriction endonuclease McrA